MSPAGYSVLINVACHIGWLMVMLPAVLFLCREWRARRDNLFNLMTDGVLELYYNRFFPSRKIDGNKREQVFRKDFGRRYGRRWYIPPLVLLGILSVWGLWGTAGTLKVWTGVAKPGDQFAIEDIALGAFLGGLTWVISDQMSRFRDRDFTSYDVYNAVFRLLIAIPLGYSLASFGDAKFKVTIAFILGAFPTSTLFTIARRLGSKQFGLADDAVDSSSESELEKLQSVARDTAERFRDEGVSSIVALAWTDPIDLTIRTNLDFSYVVDCISQALLWIYLGDDTKKLYVMSLRGAQEASALIDDAKSEDPALRDDAIKTLQAAADLLKIDRDVFHLTLRQVAEDPSTEFLMKIWEAQT
jgi:hypothetical protein